MSKSLAEIERDELLARLTDKQQELVLCRAAGMTIQEAAKKARLDYSYSRKLLTKTHVLDALRAVAKPKAGNLIATAEERQEFWTAVMRGEVTDRGIGPDGEPIEVPAKLADRLKGSELLGKAQTDFVERSEHTLTIIQQVKQMSDDEIERRLHQLRQLHD